MVNEQPLKIKSIVRQCPAAPDAWDAKDVNGIEYYIRYRHNRLTIRRRSDNEILHNSRHDMVGIEYEDLYDLLDGIVVLPNMTNQEDWQRWESQSWKIEDE